MRVSGAEGGIIEVIDIGYPTLPLSQKGDYILTVRLSKRKHGCCEVATSGARESPMMDELGSEFFTASNVDVNVRIRYFISPSS